MVSGLYNDVRRSLDHAVMKDGVEPMDLILIPGVAFDQDCNRVRAAFADPISTYLKPY
jgi:5-formyltetrahydrofolate cyclo-ligase